MFVTQILVIHLVLFQLHSIKIHKTINIYILINKIIIVII